MKIPGQVWKVVCQTRGLPLRHEFLYGKLLAAGFDPENMVEETNRGVLQLVFFASTYLKAKSILERIKVLKIPELKVSIQYLSRESWQDAWKKDIKPFSLTPKIDVIPAWGASIKSKPRKNKYSILINTNLAFGTGLHETTKFMSQIIEKCRGQFRSFLDIGTGSGILTIVANYHGAKDITAIDIDPQSIKVTKENLHANKVRGVKVFARDFAHWKNRKTYDFVAANLVTHDLVGFGKRLAGYVKHGQFLAVSGISLTNLPKLKKAFKKLPLVKVAILSGNSWAAVLYKKC